MPPTIGDLTAAASGSETFIRGGRHRRLQCRRSATESFPDIAAPGIDDFTADAAAVESFTGEVPVTIDEFTTAASGSETFTASAAAAIADFTADGEGAQSIPASAAGPGRNAGNGAQTACEGGFSRGS